MGIEDIARKMELLEQEWFDAARIARAAGAELAEYPPDETVVLALGARARLEDAELRKQEIMREIEQVEDSLLLE